MTTLFTSLPQVSDSGSLAWNSSLVSEETQSTPRVPTHLCPDDGTLQVAVFLVIEKAEFQGTQCGCRQQRQEPRKHLFSQHFLGTYQCVQPQLGTGTTVEREGQALISYSILVDLFPGSLLQSSMCVFE